MREGPNTDHRSQTLDTIPETQDMDLEVVFPNVSIGLGYLPYMEIVDPNATTLPMHSTPGVRCVNPGDMGAGGRAPPIFC